MQHDAKDSATGLMHVVQQAQALSTLESRLLINSGRCKVEVAQAVPALPTGRAKLCRSDLCMECVT